MASFAECVNDLPLHYKISFNHEKTRLSMLMCIRLDCSVVERNTLQVQMRAITIALLVPFPYREKKIIKEI